MTSKKVNLSFWFQKAKPALFADDELTADGFALARRYATRWVQDSERDLLLEEEFPEAAGLFYDIRSDAEFADRFLPDVPPVLVIRG